MNEKQKFKRREKVEEEAETVFLYWFNKKEKNKTNSILLLYFCSVYDVTRDFVSYVIEL
jgi:hypothetical protein